MLTPLEKVPHIHPRLVIGGIGLAAAAFLQQVSVSDLNTPVVALERGGLEMTDHALTILSGDMRAQLIQLYADYPWEGDLKAGIMCNMLGGRGIFGAMHRPRFYPEDFSIWPGAEWPVSEQDLEPYYQKAELDGHVYRSYTPGVPQDFFMNRLRKYGAEPPLLAIDMRPTTAFQVSQGHDSPVPRICRLVQTDLLKVGSLEKRRLFITPHAYITQLNLDGSKITSITCRDTRDPSRSEVDIEADYFVLAASTIESTRVALNSGLAADRPALGRYLAEHFYFRAKIWVPPLDAYQGQHVSVVIPPQQEKRENLEERFQFEIRDIQDPDERRRFMARITGIVALDPCWKNKVSLSKKRDPFGVRRAYTRLKYTDEDELRIKAMERLMGEIVSDLGGIIVEEPSPLPKGRSHHEAGTMRIGTDPKTSVADPFGKVHGIDNLYLADAAIFPCVGAAHPALTIIAWAYWVADHMCSTVL